MREICTTPNEWFTIATSIDTVSKKRWYISSIPAGIEFGRKRSYESSLENTTGTAKPATATAKPTATATGTAKIIRERWSFLARYPCQTTIRMIYGDREDQQTWLEFEFAIVCQTATATAPATAKNHFRKLNRSVTVEDVTELLPTDELFRQHKWLTDKQ